jgi:DNA-binding response OmpR family regulator
MTSRATKHILIAEDDAGIIEVMRIVLEGEGYSVSTAATFKEVRHELKKNPPDLFFLDIRLGGESGEAIAKDLSSNGKSRLFPLVLVSADDATKQIAHDVGADGFLLKPFDLDMLVATVKKYLH